MKDEFNVDKSLYSFIPLRLLRDMGIEKEEAQEKSLLGVKKEFTCAYLSGGMDRSGVRKAETEDPFDLMNRTLSFSLPNIVKNNGSIEDFCDLTVRALFSGRAEDALTASIAICEEFLRSEGEEEDRSKLGIPAIALTYGKIQMGVVGYRLRTSVVSMSTYTRLGAFLQKKAASLNARILITGMCAEQIPGFETRYNHRFLGKVFLKETGKEETLYDVYDGDEVAVRNLKRKTKTLFERGIKLYLQRQFAEARSCFIEVLKADRSDKAARHYLFLCDTNYNMTPAEREAVSVYLEEF